MSKAKATADLSADFRALFEASPTPFLVVTPPDWTIVAANDARLRLTSTMRAEQIGRRLFDAFPDDPDDPNADGVRNLSASLERVVATRTADTMALQRYAVRGPDGRFVERWWSAVNTPVLDDGGAVALIIHSVEEITELVRLRGEAEASDRLALHQRSLIDRLRASEAALRESETRFRNMADHAPVMMWTTDPSGSCTYLNARWYEITGQTREQAEGFGWLQATHPDDAAAAERVFLEANAARRAFRLEYRLRRADGAYRWAIDAASPRFGADGEYLGYVGSVIDIDERREAEEKLALSEERLRLAVDIGEIGEWDVDTATGVMFWPPRVKAMFGISPDVPVTLADFGGGVHPDDRERTVAAYDAAGDPDRRTLYDVEYRTVGKEDGVVRWVAAKGRGLFTADGVCCRMIGTAVDITARKADEARLRELNESLEAQVAERTADRDRMWRLSTDLMLVARFDATITAINPAWTDLLGWAEGELIGRRFLDLVHPEDLAGTLAEAGKLSEGQRTSRFENRYQHKDGSYRWLSWTAVPGDELIHAVARDITAEKEQAEALQLAEEALRQAQKMEAVGQLTGGLAHDFNNLLTGISGSLEMIGMRVAQGRMADVDRYVSAALGASKRAAALTHRLLAFSRRQTLAPKPTDVKQLVAGMEELIGRTVGPAIEIETVNAVGLWPSLIDPSQLENAILNLCINARDAMPDGGRITVETANRWMDKRAAEQRGLEPGQYISLCVSDTGTGMAANVIAKAFDPFFTTKPIGMGTGLGLSMIYGFAKQSGGSAAIYSEVGQGTNVCVYLPRHIGEAQTAELEEGVDAAPRAEAGETVLVIDDEPTVRMLVAEVLTDLGYTALEAADGAAGLKVINSDLRIDLLVTDVGLPGGMNGRQVADAARAVRPDLKVLFITGFAENAVLNHGHLSPGMHVLTKPFAMDVLAARIRELIAS